MRQTNRRCLISPCSTFEAVYGQKLTQTSAVSYRRHGIGIASNGFVLPSSTLSFPATTSAAGLPSTRCGYSWLQGWENVAALRKTPHLRVSPCMWEPAPESIIKKPRCPSFKNVAIYLIAPDIEYQTCTVSRSQHPTWYLLMLSLVIEQAQYWHIWRKELPRVCVCCAGSWSWSGTWSGQVFRNEH